MIDFVLVVPVGLGDMTYLDSELILVLWKSIALISGVIASVTKLLVASGLNEIVLRLSNADGVLTLIATALVSEVKLLVNAPVTIGLFAVFKIVAEVRELVVAIVSVYDIAAVVLVVGANAVRVDMRVAK